MLRDGRSGADAWPYTTLTVLMITAAVTALQFVQPPVLMALERTPDALSNHQYWRLITPILVHSDGWKQITLNFSAIAIAGYFAERIFGSILWLIIYLLAGFVGEIAGYAWQPLGAGASVAGAGLVGALALWTLLRVRAVQAKFGALAVLAGGVYLTTLHNIHGPPVLVGALVGLVAVRFGQRQRVDPGEAKTLK